MTACRNGDFEILDQLLHAGANPNLKTKVCVLHSIIVLCTTSSQRNRISLDLVVHRMDGLHSCLPARMVVRGSFTSYSKVVPILTSMIRYVNGMYGLHLIPVVPHFKVENCVYLNTKSSFVLLHALHVVFIVAQMQ